MMDDLDAELRSLLEGASGRPRLVNRDALLESLSARIDEGGVDVAEAPAPPPSFEAAGRTLGTGADGRARGAARVAGLGLGGWVAIGVASAAAATGAWLLDGRDFTPDPVPSVTAPVPAVVDAAGAAPQKAVTVAPIHAPQPPAEASNAGDEPPAPVAAVRSASDGADDANSGGSGHSTSVGDGSGAGSGTSGGAAGPSGGGPAAEPGSGSGSGTVDIGLDGVDQAIEDTVDGILPEGPVKDTVSPIIHAVDVNGLVGWVVTSLLCMDATPVSATVTDDVGVTAVSLDVTAGSGYTQSIPLSRGSGSTWTGVLAPVAALDLGILNRLVDVEVSARDAAGNTATSRSTVTVSALTCLGG
ncbi:hypothetical protein ACNI3K_09520 [Demequina sp. SO4-13]|uniref:hypothetical protein n=1 Tax=Demequina sp. SO4-13 TaxID=3401027 RepID=UPI003AF7422E